MVTLVPGEVLNENLILDVTETTFTLTADLTEFVEVGTEFTVDITLIPGATDGGSIEGTSLWYTYEVTGVDANGNPDVYSVTGTGLFNTNGQFDDGDDLLGLQVTIEKDWVLFDDLFKLSFYKADPIGSDSELDSTDPAVHLDSIQVDVVQTAGARIVDGVAIAEIADPDPITGEFRLPGKVKLKNRGKVPFRLYGSEDIDVNAIEMDSILFGGDPDVLMADSPAADSYFQGAQRGKGKRKGSYIGKVTDINEDGFDDIIIKAFRRDLVGVMEKGDTEIYAYAQIGEESVLWSNADAVFF